MRGIMMNSNDELFAEIRNKLQSAITALEYINAGKEVSKDLLNLALTDLKEIIKKFEERGL